MSLQTQLAEAELAYHRLMTGRTVQEVVDQNGERIRYVPASASRLAAWIQELKVRIAGDNGSTGPMRFWGR